MISKTYFQTKCLNTTLNDFQQFPKRKRRIVGDFTHLNSANEKHLLDVLNGATYDNFCIDNVDYNDDDNATTVAMICDTCSDEDPCVSICSDSRFDFEKHYYKNDLVLISCSVCNQRTFNHL